MTVQTTPDAQFRGYAPDEIVTAEPTRAARLKWVIVVDGSLAPGRIANATACVAAATGAGVPGLNAHGGSDADGSFHPGLPWTGCTVLAASPAELAALRERAATDDDILTVDMATFGQTHRVYDDYLAELAETPGSTLELAALSIVGPRNRVAKMVKKLTMLP